MKKNFRQIQSFLAGLILSIFLLPASYGQDLIISEVFANPSGSDSPFEFVEFIATKTINFGTTPYCVVWANNGTATSNGWISGSSLSYGFSITSGTVNKGDVVYVGGSSMIPTGTKLRAINTGTTAGDQFGSANASGVCGNGGSNADAIAVFNVPIASLTSSTVPIDAIFYGTGIGTALVSGGTAGYQLPVNDLYSGGKLQSNSFYAPDPASAQYLVATGTYDTLLNAFTTTRTWANSATFTDNSSSVSLTAAAPGTIAFAQTHSIFQESAGATSFQLSMSNPNSVQASATVEVVAYGTATGGGTDYSFSTQTIIFPANTGGTSNVTITIEEDAVSEAAEYIYFRLTNPVNATLGLSSYILYIKDNDNMAPAPSNELSLQLLGSYSNGASGTNSSEISDYDSISHRVFIANSIGAKLDIIDISNPSQITPVTSVSITPYGNINSVAVKNGIVAAAVENSSPQSPGKVVFFDTDGNFLAQVTVGAMPDMITFNHAGTKVYTVNEGEPNTAYTSDPEGTVSIVDISGGVGAATVATIDFTAYNGQEAALRAQGIRIYGLNATAAQDFEPEYITISEDDQTAWVNLQENNAVAVLDLSNNTITQLMPLGYKDLSLTNNSLDASDVTSGVVMANWPVKGMYLPDELSSFTVSGTPYLIMSNEGDARAYNAFNEETTIGSGSYTLDATAFPQAAYLKSNFAAGKLKVTNKLGDTDNDGDFDEIYAYGGRSFSVVNGITGALVYESGDDIEQITANDPVFSAIFNANNSASNTAKNRSDDKGPEPEGVAVSQINGSMYAFIGLERIGGVMVFNVNDPANPQFVTYGNNRSVITSAPDRGTEGIKVISAAASPTGQALVILSNEVSSTLTVYALCDGGGSLQTYYADADGDAYGDLNQTTQACTTPTGYVADNTDCDDAVAAVNPGATEVCNTIDDDCDNIIDEDGQNVFYADTDADSYGDATATTLACTAPIGYVSDNTDCDDNAAAVNPGATEVCNTIDDDCDNLIDEGGQNIFYADVDVDGYGDPSSTTQACTAPLGFVADNTDCDDNAIEVNPGEMESCNGIDDDCDNLVDEGVQTTFYADTDVDGYGDLNSTVIACMAPSGFVSDSTDCNDANAAVNPGATEICNTLDDDCDNLVDEEGLNTYYADADGDGYGDATNTTTGCTAPSGFVTDNTDCNDADALVNPGVAEVCDNSLDDNCNGTIDEDSQAPSIYFAGSALLPGLTGPSSSQSPYLVASKPGVQLKSILTVGDQVGSYRMCGLPDGLGAFDNGDGTFTVLMNHEINSTLGVTRAHGSIGAFVSKWIINKSDLAVVSGSDLIQTVYLWNTGTNSFEQDTALISRLCSADLPVASAFYNSNTGNGTPHRIFLNGEESGNEGRAFGHIASGPNSGTSYQLPYLGRFSWENAIASPKMSDKTVVGGLDDTTPGQVYFYVGTKTNTGSEIDRAGLNNGKLYGVQVTGMSAETNGSTPASGTRFNLVDLGYVQNMTGSALNTASGVAGVTTFLRPEDGAWDPSNLDDFYFVTTNNFTSPSRMWRLRFDDAANPETGGTIEALLDGTEGQKMLDNLGIDQNGHVLLQEDPGNQSYLAKIWQYTTATDELELVASHDTDRFVSGAPNFLTLDEESSGLIDVSDILGAGMFLIVDQAHYSIPGELVEGGQLLTLFNSDSYSANVVATDTIQTTTNTGCTATGVEIGTPGAWDNCSVASVTNDAPAAFPVGSTIVTWTVTDGNGNTVTGTQVVIVTVNPGAVEICNNIDDDCDNLVDEGVQTTFYADVDSDGYGDVSSTTLACTAPEGYVANSTDCNDVNAAVNPGATEICNTIDDDCDNLVDEEGLNTYYADADGDGYGDATNTTTGCTAPSGYVTDNTDCNDANALVNPGVAEVCDNSLDDNCNGTVDEDSQAPSIYFAGSALLPGLTGPSSSQSPYLVASKPGVQLKSILTVGDQVGSYRMCGLPDGLGAFDNGDGTFTVLMNHEINSTLGVTRAHGSIGAFVSKWIINKSDLAVVSGSDLIQTVYLWNTGTNSFEQDTALISRLCSADLPVASAFYNSNTGNGTPHRIFLNGEESGNEGRAFGHIASGPNSGTSYQLPYLGRFSWENAIASPKMSDKTVVGGLDDTTPGQVYFYVGTKTNTGTEIDRAGLNNGKLYGVQVTGMSAETNGSTPASGTRFNLVDLGYVQNMTGSALNTASGVAGVTTFLRPEDGAWDPTNLDDFYFVTTNNFTSPSRMWRLRFDDAANPETGGTIEAVLDGTEGQKMLDNLGIDQNGHVLLQEDPGNQSYLAKIWQYTTSTDELELVASHDTDRFVTGAPNFLTLDEESSGLIDVSQILGPGMFLIVDQAHYSIPGELVEGGQLLTLFNSDSYSANVVATDTVNTTTNTGCTATGVELGIPGAWDNCSVESVTNDAPTAFPVGSTIVTWTVTDGNGNTVTGTQVVIVTVDPGAVEICNDIDDDCDNLVDEGVQTTFYADADNDGYGDLLSTTLACTAPEGYVANSTDCNDANAAVNPGATEICNTLDDDCDNLVDEEGLNTYYADADGDGYGDATNTTTGCTAPSGYVTDNTDCNDANAAINPGATETCNETDDDCDMQIDEGVAITTYYADADGDGKGNPLVSLEACAQPVGYVSNNTDCDDNTVVACPMPTATATTDITDVSAILSWTGTNCASRYRLEYRQKTTPASPWIVVYVTESSYELTGLLEGTNYQWRVGTVCTPGGTSVPAGFTVQLQFKTKYRVYPDVDNDGYGDSNSETVLVNTFPAIGYSTDNTDCDDAVFTTHPNATELCNGVDDDCDGTVDDGIVNAPVWYQDADDDGLGNELVTLNACIQPMGYVSNSIDCDDNSNVLVCAPPTNGLVVNLSPVSATLSWSDVPCALRYTMQYRQILPTGAWSIKVNVENTSTMLTGLNPNTTYQFRVRSLCPLPNPTTSDWLTITFTTPALPMGLTEDIATTDLNMANPVDMELAVYPNPGDGRFNISLYTEQEEQEVNIMISDGFGKLVYTTKWSVFEGQNIDQLDLSFLSGGVYQVTVQQGEIIQTKKVVILR
jgi:hypothetical protein